MPVKPATAAQTKPATAAQAASCTADFTINDQHSNVKVSVGAIVTLQAEETQATQYQWVVADVSPGGNYELSGETQAQATLIVRATGAYVIQLAVEKGQSKAVLRRLLWAATSQNDYRLPATGEPLRFTGAEDWAGDLVQVIQDVDSRLPTDDQKAALDAAEAVASLSTSRAPPIPSSPRASCPPGRPRRRGPAATASRISKKTPSMPPKP